MGVGGWVCGCVSEAFLPAKSPSLTLCRNPEFLEPTTVWGLFSPALLPLALKLKRQMSCVVHCAKIFCITGWSET